MKEMKEPNLEQKKIIESKESKVVVNCSAASGKTFCLTKRLQYLLENEKNKNIVAITFTNAAANELKERIDIDNNNNNNCFIGTVHSYCNFLLIKNNIYTADIINNERYNELFELFHDNLSHKESIDYFLLDEAQDSSLEEFIFFFQDLNIANWMIFSDIKQSIYSFRNAYPQYIINLLLKDDITKYKLNKNYRCRSNILGFAKNIINKLGYNYQDNSIPDKNGGKVYEMEFTPENVLKVIKRDKDSEYKDWFVLVRSNEQVQNIYNYLTSHNIPCDTFKKSELDNNSLEQKMKENTVKVLTIHSAKGLENKNVIVGSFHFTWKDEERRLAYVAATRAIENLYWFKPKNKKKPQKTKIINWE